jgi:homoserine O-acetyltransferase
MTDEIFDSTDSIRSAAPLKHVQYFELSGPLELECGARLQQVRVAYETYGRLNAQASNAVLVCHALSGDSHVAAHDAQDEPGWWDVLVGPGKDLDTDKYFVICPNTLGGCRGTTGPNCADPATLKPYGGSFPNVSIADIVKVQAALVEHLGIGQLLAVIGGSMGGMQVLQWAIAYPDGVRCAIPVATAARLSSQALAFDVIGRNAILRDPHFHGGNYYDAGRPGEGGVFLPANGLTGLAIARMIGHITYLSRQAMAEKFGGNRHQPRSIRSEFEKDTSVASYLAHQGDKFIERFDANSYLLISRAMDRYDLGEGQALRQSLAPARCRWLVAAFTSDWLFPADQSMEIVNALLANGQGISYCNVRSACGHDAFLLPNEVATYGGMIRGFLEQASRATPAQAAAEPELDADGRQADTSIFHGRRIDYDLLEEVLASQASSSQPSVLDVGCGSGQMLLRLKRRGWRRLQGVDIHESAVLACVQRGVDCIQADANDGLSMFADKQFDVVLLSRTLQAVYNVDRLVEDMLRVGRCGIVSFPNFAYGPLRDMLYNQGRAPEAQGLLRYKWYDSPNIRFFSIADFQQYCQDKKLTVHRMLALNTETRREVKEDPNRQADLAIFVISRG